MTFKIRKLIGRRFELEGVPANLVKTLEAGGIVLEQPAGPRAGIAEGRDGVVRGYIENEQTFRKIADGVLTHVTIIGDEVFLTDRGDEPSHYLSLAKRHGATSAETDRALAKIFSNPKPESDFTSALRKIYARGPEAGLPSVSLQQSRPCNPAAAMIAKILGGPRGGTPLAKSDMRAETRRLEQENRELRTKIAKLAGGSNDAAAWTAVMAGLMD